MAGRLFAIAVLLLTPALADAAAFTSKADGNWSASGQTTWNEVGVPGNGDTVTIGAGHDITVDVNTTIGDSPATAADVITVTTTGTITVATGVTFTIKGCVTMEDGNFTMAAGSIVEFQVPSTKRYWFRTGKAANDTCKVVINGSSGSRCAFRSSSGAGIAYFDSQGFAGNSLIQAEYCDFTLIGDATEDFAEPYCNSSGQDFYLRYCTLTSCGELDTAVNVNTNASLELLNCTWATTVASSCVTLDGGSSPAGGKVHSVIGCSFDKVAIVVPTGYTLTNNYFGDGMTNTNTSAGWVLFQDNFLVKSAQGPIIATGDVANCYVYKKSVANPHFLSMTTSRGVAITGTIFEHGGTQQDGDCIVFGSPGSALVYSASNCIVLPNSNGGATGTMLTLGGSANVTMTANHNTYHSNTTSGGITIAETYTGFAGMMPSARSNLTWNQTASNSMVMNNSSTNDAVANYITNAGYNGIWNGAATTYDLAAGTINTDNRASDVTGDPDFVDETRDLASWDASLGGAGTESAALSRLSADPYLVDDLVTWVKAGFVVRNSSLNNAGHDSVTIGAMGYTPANVVNPLSSSIPGSGIDPLNRGPVQ